MKIFWLSLISRKQENNSFHGILFDECQKIKTNNLVFKLNANLSRLNAFRMDGKFLSISPYLYYFIPIYLSIYLSIIPYFALLHRKDY